MKVFHLLLLAIQLLSCNTFKYQNRPGLQNRPIVGGVDADITSVPYQVSLGNVRESDHIENSKDVDISYRHFCGGSIISVEWVLTAAHCVKEMNSDGHVSISTLRVRVGSSINTEGGRLHKVARIVFHPGFSFHGIGSDVALIKVKEPFEFGPTVQSIPLTKFPRVPGGIATVSGWGVLSEFGGVTMKLQKVQIPIMAQWECKMLYRKENITDQMFCAGRAGRSACFGDSGGPVVYNGVQIGIVSWGRSCQRPNYPGVYASVFNLRDWIHKHSGI